jgi:hypothetical protein
MMISMNKVTIGVLSYPYEGYKDCEQMQKTRNLYRNSIKELVFLAEFEKTFSSILYRNVDLD